jgi:hypothetical protein
MLDITPSDGSHATWTPFRDAGTGWGGGMFLLLFERVSAG